MRSVLEGRGRFLLYLRSAQIQLIQLGGDKPPDSVQFSSR